eukprot:sb/3478094/
MAVIFKNKIENRQEKPSKNPKNEKLSSLMNFQELLQEPTETRKQPVKTRYLANQGPVFPGPDSIGSCATETPLKVCGPCVSSWHVDAVTICHVIPKYGDVCVT